jgi:long-chain acyl-CoA synthetase
LVPIDTQLSGDALAFQLKDSGARCVVVFEHSAAALEAVLPRLPQLSATHIVIASLGDMLGPIKGGLLNYVERNKRRAMAPYELTKAVRFNDALSQGQTLPLSAPPPQHDDLAVLHYSPNAVGGKKAAVLLHRQLVAGVLQSASWFRPALLDSAHNQAQTVAVLALPWHAAMGFHLAVLLSPFLGLNCLLTHPYDDALGLRKTLEGESFNWLLADHAVLEDAVWHTTPSTVDWAALRLCLNVGLPVTSACNRAWQARSGCDVRQAYGVGETGSFAACAVLDPRPNHSGLLPLPRTELTVLDERGHHLPEGEPGYVAVRGPQLMAGYWLRPEETARALTPDGFMRTGDWGELQDGGGLMVLDQGFRPARRSEALLYRPETRSSR